VDEEFVIADLTGLSLIVGMEEERHDEEMMERKNLFL